MFPDGPWNSVLHDRAHSPKPAVRIPKNQNPHLMVVQKTDFESCENDAEAFCKPVWGHDSWTDELRLGRRIQWAPKTEPANERKMSFRLLGVDPFHRRFRYQRNAWYIEKNEISSVRPVERELFGLSRLHALKQSSSDQAPKFQVSVVHDRKDPSEELPLGQAAPFFGAALSRSTKNNVFAKTEIVIHKERSLVRNISTHEAPREIPSLCWRTHPLA